MRRHVNFPLEFSLLSDTYTWTIVPLTILTLDNRFSWKITFRQFPSTTITPELLPCGKSQPMIITPRIMPPGNSILQPVFALNLLFEKFYFKENVPCFSLFESQIVMIILKFRYLHSNASLPHYGNQIREDRLLSVVRCV